MIMDLIERNETMICMPKCMRPNEARAVFFEQTPLCHESTIFVGSSGRIEAPGHRFWVLPQTKTGRPTNDGDD